jgi:hypothetical protein
MPVQLPKMENVRLQAILWLLVRQAEGDFFVDTDGIVEVVAPEVLMESLLSRRTSVRLERKPLADALREFSDDTGCSIVLDERRAGDRAKALVTVDLRHTSIKTAVGILADLADLKVVQLGRALYVTSPEYARAIRAIQERKVREEEKRAADEAVGTVGNRLPVFDPDLD